MGIGGKAKKSKSPQTLGNLFQRIRRSSMSNEEESCPTAKKGGGEN